MSRILQTSRKINFVFFQAEDGIRDVERSRGLGDVYKRQLSHLGILNHFHIIIESAFNLNKTKIYFSACLQNSRHFEFQISSTQGKFIDFPQKLFFDRESFHNGFFQRMGGKRARACAGPAGPAPSIAEKIRYETILDEKKTFL